MVGVDVKVLICRVWWKVGVIWCEQGGCCIGCARANACAVLVVGFGPVAGGGSGIGGKRGGAKLIGVGRQSSVGLRRCISSGGG